MEAVKCAQCKAGFLVPLSDMDNYGSAGGGATIPYKAWVCNSCDFIIRMDRGAVKRGTLAQYGPNHGSRRAAD